MYHLRHHSTLVASLMIWSIIPISIEGQQLRLAESPGSGRGRIEVFLEEQWGSVCDDGWDIEDARVACHQLGWRNGFPNWGARYGQSTGPIHISNVRCQGDEGNLLSCRHDDRSNHGCAHDRDAGVDCFNELPVNLVGGYLSATHVSGRVEIQFAGQWGTICDVGFTDREARVVCSQLGLHNGRALGGATHGPGVGPVWMQGVSCPGNPASLSSCLHRGLGVTSGCDHYADVSVLCDRQLYSTSDPGGGGGGGGGGQTQPGGTAPVPTLSPGTPDVRLIGGESSAHGRVEVYHAGVWGTVCSDRWGHSEARVVCRQLGWSEGLALSSDVFGPGSGPIWLDEVTCSGFERHIVDCPAQQWGQHNCDHQNDAAVTCFNSGPNLRLGSEYRNNTHMYGRVEVNVAGQWGTVCDNQFTDREARVVCRQLGFQGGRPLCCGALGQALSLPIWIQHVACRGHEDRLEDCDFAEPLGRGDCNHGDDVGVWCELVTAPSPGPGRPSTPSPGPARPSTPSVTIPTTLAWVQAFRLVGPRPGSGRVEVSRNGQWGTVCEHDWGTNDARVLCRSLGWAMGFAVYGAAFGQGTGPVWLSDMDCVGDEANLLLCRHSDWGVNDCDHSKDAGVDCFNSLPVRLVNSGDITSSFSGRLEVFFSGEWGTVCGRFSSQNARVVCRQLGFEEGTYSSGRSDVWGPTWLSHLECSGQENTVGHCYHTAGIGINTCDHSDDVSVTCRDGNSGPTTRSTVGPTSQSTTPDFNAQPNDVRLMGSADTSRSGRVEIFHDGRWGTVCDDWWDNREARVVCRQLGWRYGFATPGGAGGYGPGSGDIWLDNVICLGSETSLSECLHNGWGNHDCDHAEDAGVDCFHDLPVRLVGGANTLEGRVEIFFNSEWGTVCNSNFDDEDARVVCRQLGLPGGSALPCCNAFPAGSGSIYLEHVNCQGDEASLIYCVNSGISRHSCTHRMDAGVRCDSPPGGTTTGPQVNRWYGGSCGISKYPDAGAPVQTPFIVGGGATRYNEFPWMVSVQGVNNKHFCGGVIINPYWVMWAAHCQEGVRAEDIILVTGEHRLYEYDGSEAAYHVQEFYAHPEYDRSTLQNDLALIRLTSPIVMGPNTQPACPPDTGTDHADSMVQVAGWGQLTSDGPGPNELYYTTLNVIPNEDCRTFFGSRITRSMMCATDTVGGTERDACYGDSGGPLTLKDDNGRFQLVGIVSWGGQCAGGAPGVYTRVNEFLAWIYSHVREDL